MKVQNLKILPQYFEAIKDGRKTFELRKNDRFFEIGDLVFLYEFANGEYTGRVLEIGYINYIFEGDESLGLSKGYIIFSTDLMEFNNE